MANFSCSICQTSFDTKDLIEKHMKLHCSECGKFFMRKSRLTQHEKTHASSSTTNCSDCKENVLTSSYGYHIRTNKHRANCGKPSTLSPKLKVRNSDFSERIEIYTFTNERDGVTIPEEFFMDIEEIITNLLNECLAKHILYKFNMELMCEYVRMGEGEDMTMGSIGHISKMRMVTIDQDIVELYKSQCIELCTKMSEFQERDSGWTLVNIKFIEININQASIIRGSQYIPSPDTLKKKNATLNIENYDVYCFKWCIIAAMHCAMKKLNHRAKQSPHSYNISNIDDEKINVGNAELDFSSMDFPLKIKGIQQFEKQNKNISINVFGYEADTIVGPYYFTQEEKQTHINLILLTDKEKSHYVLINDISR